MITKEGTFWQDAQPQALNLPRTVQGLGARLLASCLLLLSLLLIGTEPPRTRVVIAGTPGAFEILVNGRPFYIRGVSFSTNEGPDDPSEPLSPSRLSFHFRRIRGLGANSIRRYGYDADTAAVLDAAWRHNLMVILGFWLDHDVDYLMDQRQLDRYRARIQEWVMRFRTHPAVLTWVLGNETWGLLKGEFDDPEQLFPRREAYYRFVNEMALLVKSLDPARPVMTVDEHLPDWSFPWHLGLQASLAMFRRLVPSVDIFGINSYFQQDISGLHSLVVESRIDRPYVVSEFGPPGYWLPHRLIDDLGEPVEPSDFRKATAYFTSWTDYVQPYRGWNLGGNAFVWKDKHEGSFTWFGLTDSRDRLKPAYWALREAWTGKPVPRDRPVVVAFAINKRWMRPEESFVVQTRLLPALDPTNYRYTYLIAPARMTHVVSQFTTDLSTVSLEAPGIPGVYRVYVYATTRDDRWVSTGSATFAVYEPGRRP